MMDMADSYLITEPEDAKACFLFAHGAGAGMDHEFMQAIATGLTEYGIRVIRFDFPYMVKRREDGKKRPPDRQPKLLADLRRHIDKFSDGKLVIGGKSMGGRMASLIVSDQAGELACADKVQGLACLGFPFHPPGKPENYKGDHLAELTLPTLILQGERDTFGKREEVECFSVSHSVAVHYVPDGDHSFKPRKASGYTEQGNRELVVDRLAQFILECVA